MWWSILKRQTISIYSRKIINEVMDETPRSVNEILDLIFDKVEERRKIKGRGKGGMGANTIPTRNELIKYLSLNYNSILVDKITGKEITTGRRTQHRETRYFR